MLQLLYISIVDISDKNGQGIYALKTLESFVDNCEDCFLDIVLPRPKKNVDLLEKIKENSNIKIHFLKMKKERRNIFWHLLIQIQLFFILIKIGKRDALVYSLKPTMVAPVIYSKIFKVPIFLLIEGLAKNTIKKLTKGIFRKIGSFILEWNIKTAKKVYPAYLLAKEWVDEIRKNNNSQILHCGVDLNIFKPQHKDFTKQLTIGYVGSFRREHLLLELLQASLGLDLKIVLIGEGDLKKDIENFIMSNNLNNVICLGSKSQKDLVSYFKEFDIMWGATDEKNWGIPIKCFEYLACNKKVICTKKNEFEFVEKNKLGYILKHTNINSIKNLLVKILNEYKQGKLKDNKDSRKYIINNNNWNNFAKIVLKDIKNDN